MCDLERDLGPLGEAEFKRLCFAANSKLTVHESVSGMDRTGWDFLIEFPMVQGQENYPVDLVEAPIECKVQLKSTDKKRKSEGIKVSNLLRLVKAQMPTFYCFMEFDGQETVQAIYLVHVDEALIERVLRKVRELEMKGEGENLNKHKIYITYDDSNQLNSPSGKEIKKAVESFVTCGMEEYIKSKNKALSSVGFEDGKYQANVTIVGEEDAAAELIDVMLGLRPNILVKEWTGFHKRFEFLTEDEKNSAGEGKLYIKPNPISCNLILTETETFKEFCFQAKFYGSSFCEFVDDLKFKARIESRFFEFILEAEKIHLKVRPYLEERTSLDELSCFLQVMSRLEDSTCSFNVAIDNDIFSQQNFLEISKEDFNLSDFEIKSEDGLSEPKWASLLILLKSISRIFDDLEISSSQILINVDDLLYLRNDSEFIVFRSILEMVEPDVASWMKQKVNESSQKIGNTMFQTVAIGNCGIGVCLATISSPYSLQDGTIGIKVEKVMLGRCFHQTGALQVEMKAIESGIEYLSKRLEAEGIEVGEPFSKLMMQ